MAVLLALAATPLASAQQLPTPEEAREIMRRHRERTRGTITLRRALRGVLGGRGAPGGIVLYPLCGEEQRVPAAAAAPPGASLAEALDALVAAAPRYVWRSEDGVVNFFPAGTHTPLLDLRVARFRAENVRTPGEALVKLLDTPEVREAMTRPEVGPQLFRGGLGYYDPNPNGPEGAKVFSVSLDGATVREALNAIARAHGRAMWSHRGAVCSGRSFFELEFLTWEARDAAPPRGARAESTTCACELVVGVEDGWDGAGASVPVRLTIRNKGARVIYWVRNRSDGDSPWALRDAAGRLITPAEDTPPEDTTLKVKEGSYERVTVESGKEFSYSTRLGRRRLPPGEYALEGAVAVYLSDLKTKVNLTSAPVKLRVNRGR